MIVSGPSGLSCQIEQVTNAAAVVDFIVPILETVRAFRGGPGLIAELCDGHSEAEAIDRAVMNGELWSIAANDGLVGLLVIRRGVLLGIHLVAALRRNGIARATVTALRDAGVVITDARALPGDRATKSLFESMGWKARLLTMAPTQQSAS